MGIGDRINKKSEGGLKGFLAKAVTGTFGFKIINAFLLYFNSLLLARVLGVSGFGVYSYAGAWVNLLLVPAVLGMESLILRESTVYQTQSKWSFAKGLLTWSSKLVLVVSILIAVVTCLIFWWAESGQDPGGQMVIFIAMASLPFLALSRLRQSAMQSLDRIVLGQLPEMLVNPLTISLFLLLIVFVVPIEVNAATAMSVKAIAAAITFMIGGIFLQANLPSQVKQATPKYQQKVWLKQALPMLLIGGMYIINNQTDTVMLGFLSSKESVGIYTVANRGASLIGFILIAFNSATSPTFARLYADGDRQKLQQIVTQCCRIIFGTALIVASVLIVFGGNLLALFGSEFVQGRTVLTILSIGQLANAFTGSIALLLIMTGNEKLTAVGVGISAVLNIILNGILIPQFNAEGAAIATAVSMTVWNLILIMFTQQKLKINSTPF